MKRSSITMTGKQSGVPGPARSPVEILAEQVGRLLRHPAYRRASVVSPLLLRHLPADARYDWNGEAALRRRLVAADLDPARLEHLMRNVQAELLRLRRPADA